MKYFGDLVSAVLDFFFSLVFFGFALDVHSWWGWLVSGVAGLILWKGVDTLKKRDVKICHDNFLQEVIRAGAAKGTQSVMDESDAAVAYINQHFGIGGAEKRDGR